MLSFILLDLTMRDIVAEIPHDAAAIVVYVMLALFIGFIWTGSRGGGSGDTTPPGGQPHVR